MATNPFAQFISGEALTAQPKLSYLSLLGDQRRSKDPSSRYEYFDWQGQERDYQRPSRGAIAQHEMFGNPFGTSPASRRYFQGQFQNIYDEFLGQQGKSLQGGQMPGQNFQQFLQEFPFTQRYAALPPEMTGRTLGSFAPRGQYSYL